jgi:hypothetical protein
MQGDAKSAGARCNRTGGHNLLGPLVLRLCVVELGHVLIAAADLDAAARQLETEHGLVSIEGGRHPGWGTANRIVPLGATYLELVAVVDEAEASQSAFGRWVAASRSGAPFGWAVRTPDLDAVAGRLGLTVNAGSRLAPDGGRLTWRMAGIERAAAEPSLPFVIEWGPDTPFPGAAGSHVDVSLQLRGDARRLTDWLGQHQLPITVRPGAPAVQRVTAGERRLG